jgi:hypothetical protein
MSSIDKSTFRKEYLNSVPNYKKESKSSGEDARHMSNMTSTIKKIEKLQANEENDAETTEATSAGSSGAYSQPLFGDIDTKEEEEGNDVPTVREDDSIFLKNPKKNTLFQPGTEIKEEHEEEKISGGLADGMSLIDIANHHDTTVDEIIDKVSQGVNTEMEHTSDVSIALEIALDHIYENLNYYSKLKKIEATEATTSASVGAYDAPIGGGRKDPLKIDTPKSVYSKLKSVKDPKFPKYGGPGGKFVRVKDKCKRYPYCNQGDIKALEFFENNLVKEAIENIKNKYNLNESYIKSIILENTNIYYKTMDMNKELENMIDNIVDKVLSEEIETKTKSITESVKEEIDEMEEFYEIAKMRKEERMNKKEEPKEMEGDNLGEEEVEEGSAFVLAADAAKDAGKDEFEFPKGSGKMHKVTIKTDIKTESKKQTLKLTEDEMIDFIEKIIQEEKIEGTKQQDKAMKETEKSNKEALENTSKKMKEYTKEGSKGKYEEMPESFPKGNGEMKEMNKKAFQTSEDADEFIETYAFPGMLEVDYDIKPSRERIEMYVKGDDKTGNAEIDKDGKPKGNVVRNKELGEKLMKKYEDGKYQKNKETISYTRQPQPIIEKPFDEAGENVIPKNIRKKTKVNEDIDRIKGLIGFNYSSQ